MPAPAPLAALDPPSSLETPRLHLRSFVEDDAPALHEALVESLPDLRRHLGHIGWVAEAPTLESARARCRKAQADFLLRTDLPWLAFEPTTGRLVASFGLHRTDWSLPRTEIGCWVRSSQAGRGHAGEGVSALAAWALGPLKAVRVEFVTDESNHGARAVALRCGFVLEGTHRQVQRDAQGRLRNLCVYARLGPSETPPGAPAAAG